MKKKTEWVLEPEGAAPIKLACGDDGELFISQDDDDDIYVLKGEVADFVARLVDYVSTEGLR